MTQSSLLIYDIADTLVETLARESRLILTARGLDLNSAWEIPILPAVPAFNGCLLHANPQVAHRRDQLERLMRYTGRGALERFEKDANEPPAGSDVHVV